MLRFPTFPDYIHLSTFETNEASAYWQDGELTTIYPNNHNPSVECQQVHGSKIKIIKNYVNKNRTVMPDCDGLLTNLNDITLVIRHADCFPIFLFDPIQKVIGLLHSGWKGVRDHIILSGLNQMQSEFDSKPGDILVGIGPGARQCCYLFESDWNHSQLLKIQSWDPYIKRQGKYYYVDLPAYIKNDAIIFGVAPENIEDCGICTICDERFYSWTRQRQNGEKTVNGVSIIRLI